jgi:penicillin-binding protein 2
MPGETIFVGIGQGAVTVTPVQLLRAISAISMGGKLVVPHVINPTDMPPGYVEAAHFTDVKNVPLDPNGWNYITDAMERCCCRRDTAPLAAHIPGLRSQAKLDRRR